MWRLRHPDEYPFNEGRLVSNRGLDIDAAEYEDHFVEQHVKHSNALHSVLRGRGSYLVGPLGALQPELRQASGCCAASGAREVGLQPPVKNPFRSIVVRASSWSSPALKRCESSASTSRQPRRESRRPTAPASGQAITEAPRGILYHRYAFDEKGLIVTAKIVPPTSQNLQTDRGRSSRICRAAGGLAD